MPPSDKPTIVVHQMLERRSRGIRNGWTAPADVKIMRKEIAEAKAAEARVQP